MIQKGNINSKYWNFFYEKKNSVSKPSKFSLVNAITIVKLVFNILSMKKCTERYKTLVNHINKLYLIISYEEREKN